MSGTLTERTVVVTRQAIGSLTGTVAAGQNPSVDITLANQCPDFSPRFSGALDSANDLLTISGPVEILLADCTILLSFQTTIVMRRSA